MATSKEFPEIEIKPKKLRVVIVSEFELKQQDDVEQVRRDVDDAADKLRELGSADVTYEVSDFGG